MPQIHLNTVRGTHNLKTYYARHTKISISDSAIRDLKERQLIAIHYPEAKNRPIPANPDSESLNPNDYESAGARRALGGLIRLAKEGGYVVAQYRGMQTLVVGKVKADSQVMLERNLWNAVHRGEELYPNRVAILKTLAYEKLCELKPSQQKNALAIAPQQSTLCEWHAIGDKVKNLAEGKDSILGLSDLHFSEQEVLCGEFLRAPSIEGVPTLATLLMPMGRTAKDVDIYGVATDGRRLLAQVKYTHTKNYVSDLHDRFGDDDCHLLLFSGIERSDLSGRVLQISLQEVYSRFCSTERGAEWLRFISTSL